MEKLAINKSDEVVMKLLHYFVTEEHYSPIILHGAKDEIWLQNLDQEYKIIRISTALIYNNDQMNFDIFRTKQIMKEIKKKTYTFNMKAISIFLNLGDNVDFRKIKEINAPADLPVDIAIDSVLDSTKKVLKTSNLVCIDANTITDLNHNKFILEIFPTFKDDTTFKEKGLALFEKITKDISDTNAAENSKAEHVFARKKPVVTYALIIINVIVFLLMYLLGNGSEDNYTLLAFGALYAPYVKAGEVFRLITCAFLHSGLVHLVMNMYALYIIGSQIESFYGKRKYLLIYGLSAITGSLLSMAFSTNAISIGASGAIFGLLGSLLCFGYYYRLYLGSVLTSQVIPVIVLNLLLGFIVPGIDVSAHIGGLIGGFLITMALGTSYKSKTNEQHNGWILLLIYIVFLIYLAFIR